MTRVAIVGSGSWGTAVGSLVARHADVVMWAREAEVVAGINGDHRNPMFLSANVLPPNLTATASIDEALADADLVVLAVPSPFFRVVVRAAAPAIPADRIVISLTKGLEDGTLLRMTEVAASELTGHDPARLGVLSGPNLAREVIAGQPAATVVAFPDPSVAQAVQGLLMDDAFRVYTSTDVIGCEIGGSVKNVVALAAGMAVGLGYGANSQAALVTRGLAELTRLGVALGGEPLTFLGLAGMGDLYATCISPQSRNRTVGEELGRDRPLDEILAGMTMVAEGVRTAGPVVALAARVGVEMPVAEQVLAVLEGHRRPADAVRLLMRRPGKSEFGALGVPAGGVA